MDAHYAALPWPTGRLEPGRWQTSVDFASASTRTDFIELDGPMVAVAGARGVTSRVGFELIAFYGDMNVSGADGQSLLATSFLRGLPLDLPQLADWSHPRGSMRHFGAGAAMVRELAPTGVPRSAEFVAGVYSSASRSKASRSTTRSTAAQPAACSITAAERVS